MSETIGLFPGTFDPPTLGHLDIIERGAKLCDKLYVGIAHNAGKPKPLFSKGEREAMLQELTHGLANVEVVSFNELAVDFVKRKNISFIIRGLRPLSNTERELQMALANRQLEGIETLFLMADEKYAHISSRLIREIACFGHDLEGFVPEEIKDIVHKKVMLECHYIHPCEPSGE